VERRRLASILPLLLAGAFTLTPAATAAADAAAAIAPGTVRVQLRSAPARIDRAGSVRTVLWTTCSPDVFLFEIDVTVVQGDTIGQVTLLRDRDELPACDGHRHRVTVAVTPDQGTFHNGTAGISAFVGAFDGVNDADLEARDDVTVRLHGCALLR
jgi:hypothetical protein